ncbi:ribosomal protection-like ABC-F family protein [Ruminococcus sp.]|uniref:ribosomal protection-like ABC-F family protein n=1 Tax=Ruminococcus sp. TaxID=41978 RepID=UPI0025F73E71|nr:ABC-F family ATP-binding cassette domain-containing protein [Ruminococcus sp.]MBQ8965998.1 ABC-F family ATP-binding cassette domain-containing protein [Ruminococcus sp.]
MSQISVNSLTFGYDGSADDIFENVSFSIDTNWKLGFIGRNGKGKTTFLRLLTGAYPYKGTIESSARFEYFPYPVKDEHLAMNAADILDELKPSTESWRVICELSLLGEEADILYRPFGQLSHGQRTKLLLALLFSGDNEFLLIDEPTNHLDSPARDKVREYLSGKKGFILVSHDRGLLDACTDHVLVLNRRSIEVQSGNFSSWWENKQRADSFALSENEKHRKEIKKLRQAARRTRAWAEKSESTKIGFDPVKENDRSISTRSYIGSKTKKMQSRAADIEKRIDREIDRREGLLQDIEQTRELKLTPLKHHKSLLVNLQDYSFTYQGSPSPTLSGLTFMLAQGERIALDGANGCGKSTLIKRLLQSSGEDSLPAFTERGLCETATGLIVSYVSQDTSFLSGSVTDLCLARSIDRSLFCTILRQLGFERSQFDKDIASWSAGQKKKALLAASLSTPAHLYIWDEPLNFIDIFSRIQIEDLLLQYQPTMLFVEHDAKFREKIATRTVSL